ncbi:MAG TPA: DUF1643 domain-containing protein [Solirubrobacteraceae bacterium]|jgi:hypothetical protein
MKAVLSDDGVYRYALWRETGIIGGEGTVLFVMLNPSTADAEQDDPTIRRCIGFARRWGYERLAVGNLYALRSTDPKALALAEDAIGPENDRWLCHLAEHAWEVVLAWGAHPFATDRARDVRQLVEGRSGGSANCLGQTKNLSPKHPLYLPKSAVRVPFQRYGEMPAVRS